MLIALIMLSDSILVIIAQYFFETFEDVIKWQQVSETKRIGLIYNRGLRINGLQGVILGG